MRRDVDSGEVEEVDLSEREYVTTGALGAQRKWREIFSENSQLTAALAAYVGTKRWYRDKARTELGVELVEEVPLSLAITFLVVRVNFDEGAPSEYGIPVALLRRHEGERKSELGDVIITEVDVEGTLALLVDATSFRETTGLLLDLIVFERRTLGDSVKLVGRCEEALESEALPSGRLLPGDQTNTNYQYGERYVLKLLRKLESDKSLELEVLAQLFRVGFPHAPRLLGTLELRRALGASSTVGILQTFVPNGGDAWHFARESAERFVQKAMRTGARRSRPNSDIFAELIDPDPPSSDAVALVSSEEEFFVQMGVLGRRTAQLHQALSLAEEPDSKPEEGKEASRSAFFRTLSQLESRAFALLWQAEKRWPEEERDLLDLIMRAEEPLREKINALSCEVLSGVLIRVHGDLHLGQVLLTGGDFVFVDFEGEPAKEAAERRRKRSPLADIAGILRSLHYAAYSQFLEQRTAPAARGRSENDVSEEEAARGWVEIWQHQAGARFLKGYTQEDSVNCLLPRERGELQTLLEAHLLEKVLYEVIYELENRPAWVGIPLRALVSLSDRKLG